MGCAIEITNCIFLIPDHHWCRCPSRPPHDQKNWIGQFGANKVKSGFVFGELCGHVLNLDSRTPVLLNLRSNQSGAVIFRLVTKS
jgi:hypothetical protein